MSGSCRNLQASTPISRSSDAVIAKRSFSPDKDSCYHGPTSAVFDEKLAEGPTLHSTASVAKVSDVWVTRQLIAESVKQRQLETVNFLAESLDFDGVDPELGMHLLSVYWSRQPSSGPIVYRTAFMRDMACAGPYFSKLLLNAIYFYACKYTSRVEVRRDAENKLTAGWMYRQRAVELLSKCFDKSHITTIQALLLIGSALFSWCDEKSTSWLYAGIAFNMIIDLGINVDAATLRRHFTEEEVEIRQRVFWSAYGKLSYPPMLFSNI
jgi:Fungal specific transcription factor domain